MNRTCIFVLLLTAVLCAAGVAQTAGKKPSATSADSNAGSAQAVLGDWHGTSLCVVKPSACHDEEALYHVKAGESGKLQVQADKIVDGQPVNMGTIDCTYNAAKKLLHCEWAQGILDLTLLGDRLEGSMSRPDKTKWREIKLARVKI